jgi:hypothetical protein
VSAGPIKAERDGHKVGAVSTPDSKRVCMRRAPDSARSYCGRSKASRIDIVDVWAKVHCADCEACLRADEAVAS